MGFGGGSIGGGVVGQRSAERAVAGEVVVLLEKVMAVRGGEGEGGVCVRQLWMRIWRQGESVQLMRISSPGKMGR